MPTGQSQTRQRTDHGVHKPARRAKTIRSGHVGRLLSRPMLSLAGECVVRRAGNARKERVAGARLAAGRGCRYRLRLSRSVSQRVSTAPLDRPPSGTRAARTWRSRRVLLRFVDRETGNRGRRAQYPRCTLAGQVAVKEVGWRVGAEAVRGARPLLALAAVLFGLLLLLCASSAARIPQRITFMSAPPSQAAAGGSYEVSANSSAGQMVPIEQAAPARSTSP